MKIVHFCNSINIQGGYERVVVNLSNLFIENGYDVEIWLWNENVTPYYSLNPKVKVFSLNKSLKNFLRFPLFIRFFLFLYNKYTLSNSLQKKLRDTPDLDVLLIHRHSFTDRMDRLDKHFANSYNLLHTDYSNIYCNRINFFYRFFKVIKKTTSNLIFLTEKSLQDSILDGCENVYKINNILPLMSDIKSDFNSKNILSVGRYGYQKNFEFLISGFSTFSSDFPEWKLCIIGSGVSESESLIELIKFYNLENKVVLLNQQSDLSKYYLSASLFVLSSRWEGFPLVILEAMEFGLTTIVPDINGINEVVNNQNSFIYESNNLHSFVDKLKLAATDIEFRSKILENSLQTVNKYRPNVILKKWDEFFIKTLS